MKDKIRLPIVLIVGCAVIVAVLTGTGLVHAQDDQVTLTGEINDTFQLVANGKLYDIAETPEGDDLVRNYISTKVKVTGWIEKGPEIDVIRVRGFEVVDE